MNTKLNYQINESQTDMLMKQNSELEHKLNEEQAKQADMNTEMDAMSVALDEKEKKNKTLEEDKARLLKNNKRLESDNELLNAVIKEIQDKESVAIENKQTIINSLLKGAEEREEAMRILELTKVNLEYLNQRLEEDKTLLEVDINKAQVSIDELTITNKALEEENKELETSNAKITEYFLGNISQLTTTKKTLEKDKTLLEVAINEAKHSVAELTTLSKQLEEKNKQLQEKNNQLQEKNNQITQDLRSLRVMHKHALSEKDMLTAENKKLNQQNEDLANDLVASNTRKVPEEERIQQAVEKVLEEERAKQKQAEEAIKKEKLDNFKEKFDELVTEEDKNCYIKRGQTAKVEKLMEKYDIQNAIQVTLWPRRNVMNQTKIDIVKLVDTHINKNPFGRANEQQISSDRANEQQISSDRANEQQISPDKEIVNQSANVLSMSQVRNVRKNQVQVAPISISANNRGEGGSLRF